MSKITRRAFAASSAAAAAVAGFGFKPASAQAYPARPVTVIVPWGAGGGTDATARIVAMLLEKDLGQPFNVVNRTGGSGVVGHSDEGHSLTYAGIEPLPFPSGASPDAPAPTRYQGTMHLLPVVEGNRTFIEWTVTLDTAPQDAERWRTLFQSWIPDWTHSLERTLGLRM